MIVLTKRHLNYGDDPSQIGDLYLPVSSARGTICLFHGGFWKMPYDLHQLDSVCQCLASEGFVVWNIEYRRTGVPHRQWTDPFEDAIAAVNYLIELKADVPQIDLDKLVFAGHSAGGHLALWLASYPDFLSQLLRVTPMHVMGLAPVLDLDACFAQRAGGDAVEKLLQGSPSRHPQRYAGTSPTRLLPCHIPLTIFHGDKDEALPVETARQYIQQTRRYHQQASLCEIKNGQHMDFVDIHSPSVAHMLEQLNVLFER